MLRPPSAVAIPRFTELLRDGGRHGSRRRSAIQASTTRGPATASDWLSLGPAARLLGVDVDTLRRWADSGRIEAFLTPGGHRRFSRRSIDRLIARQRTGGETVPLARLGATTERLSAAYRRSSSAHPHRLPAGAALEGGDREAVRLDGRGLVDALVRYLDAAGDVEARGRIESEATEFAVDLARRLEAAGVALPDAVARFISARQPLLEELGRVARRRHLEADRLTAIFVDASAVLDRLLVAFVAAHEAARPAAVIAPSR